MAGIMEKIGDALHIGAGDKKKEEHKGEGEQHYKKDENKEGIVEKIKDKIYGEEGSGDHKEKKGKDEHEKKKNDKKKKDHGNSSGDSD